MEGDVAEAQSRHDREGPVNAGQPCVVLTFGGHDEMKEDAVNDHHDREDKQELEQLAEVVLGALPLEEVADQDRVVLHDCGIPVNPTAQVIFKSLPLGDECRLHNFCISPFECVFRTIRPGGFRIWDRSAHPGISSGCLQ